MLPCKKYFKCEYFKDLRIKSIKNVWTIEDLKDCARQRGGECLTDHYVNGQQKIVWRCERGHEWSAIWMNIRKGHWCPKCNLTKASQLKKTPIEKIQQIATQRGGELLSTEYINSKQPLIWKCSYGHEWESPYYLIKQGSWCPHCKGRFTGERFARYYIERSLGTNFPQKKPEWLTFDGKRLELDGYNKDLKIAFEHQGIQHYASNNYFNRIRKKGNTFESDRIKRKLCEEKGVLLIEIPAIGDCLSREDFPLWLKERFDQLGVKYVISPTEIKMDQEYLYKIPSIERVLPIIESKGGRLVGVTMKYSINYAIVECDKGHRWEIRPTNLRAGSWCKKCFFKH